MKTYKAEFYRQAQTYLAFDGRLSADEQRLLEDFQREERENNASIQPNKGKPKLLKRESATVRLSSLNLLNSFSLFKPI